MVHQIDSAKHEIRGPEDRLFVVSGCSGSGKSTLIAALAERGEDVVAEPGREIVKEQLARGGDALPWADRQRFIELCAERAIRDHERRARLRTRCFFDRSFVDVASAVRLTGLRMPESLEIALGQRRYASPVFVSPPWEALFRPDPQRRHGFGEAVAEYRVLVPTFEAQGYELVFLPRAPLAERVAFVAATLAERSAGLASWPVLPEAPLSAPGPDSSALRRLGCASYREAARALHELPYGRNSDRSDYRLVLREGRSTCSTKHALLAAVAREQDLPVELRIGIYDMAEANTPGVGRVLSAHGLASLPEAHCYLSYAGLRIDVTRSGVSPETPIGPFREEWTIEPSQIGDHKVALHQRYLRAWLRQRRDLDLSFEALWKIRESCILALADS